LSPDNDLPAKLRERLATKQAADSEPAPQAPPLSPDPPPPVDRKTDQLCGQVLRSLELILGAAGDERLHELTVLAVEPAPHSGRLRVLVTAIEPGSVTEDEAMTALRSAAGWLRARVGDDIHRKRVPSLHYAWIPPGAVKRLVP
jgi:ribosome-binding factor A